MDLKSIRMSGCLPRFLIRSIPKVASAVQAGEKETSPLCCCRVLADFWLCGCVEVEVTCSCGDGAGAGGDAQKEKRKKKMK